jgi:hypothetical protein
MSRSLRLLVLASGVASASTAAATPSTIFWTPATTYTQPAGVPHLTYDTYFGEAGALQIDLGLTVGLLGRPRLKIEAGLDVYHPTLGPRGQLGTLDYAQLNAKVTFGGSPALSVGIANVGFEQDVSNYHTLYAVIGGPTGWGAFTIGAYYGLGSEYLWRRMEGQMRGGVLASWVSRDVPVGVAGIDKIVFLVDLAAGMNWMGGAGAGVGLYLTPAVVLRTGPMAFLDWPGASNSGLPWWLWSVQLDVDFDLAQPKGTAAARATD